MRRRVLLSSVALSLSATAGCLSDARRQVSGPIRFGHARGRLHDAERSFVRGGLGGSPTEESYAVWLFPEAPPSDVSVFTDALGAETQREWDNEVHNENYDEGFILLAQIRTPGERATTLSPVPHSCDPGWTGWRRARIPLGLERTDLSDDLADATAVVATLATYVESSETPRRATVPFLSEAADSCDAANATLTARPWTNPA
ncbi:hypothetical protein [Salinigranum sp.]|uniref:hypothetical protein n=1 Tax=Salinigranum sp. TaxID=1966351 RepID=UPI00356AE822